MNKNIFLNFKIPVGRGDHSVIKINNKKINLIDQSYNSNPLSLKSAIKNYDKIDSKKSQKYLLIGDMLNSVVILQNFINLLHLVINQYQDRQSICKRK